MSQSKITILRGDITQQNVDAIVNAANNSLLGGGGVDGAIHSAAGPELVEECRTLGGCATGSAKITKGYKLPARWVIHTVGPVWQGGRHGENKLLAGCYQSVFALVRQHKIKSVAFPSISTGAYGYPVDQASRIALSEMQGALRSSSNPESILVVCFDSQTYQTYLKTSEKLLNT